MYDWIGISINTKDELEKFVKFQETENKLKNITIITNFNVQNVFLFDLIEKFVVKNNLMWTIQFTVYNDNNPLALYSDENETALLFLKDKYIETSANVLLSDNISKYTLCGAGMSSIGILYNGDVVPCLSMRSWNKDMGDLVDGNILETPLRKLWIGGFQKQRFECFKCCKDICKNKYLEKIDFTNRIFEIKDRIKSKKEFELIPPTAPIDDFTRQTIIYAVRYPDTTTQLYAVSIPNQHQQVQMYAVQQYLSDNKTIQEINFEEKVKKTKKNKNVK